MGASLDRYMWLRDFKHPIAEAFVNKTAVRHELVADRSGHRGN
jgi:hypothetical protein